MPHQLSAITQGKIKLIKRLKNKMYEIQNSIYDSRASTELSRIGIGYQPWSGAALRPSAMVGVLNEIVINNRNSVVEFGCGISTLYISKILSNVGGKVVSFEQDAEWAALVRNMIREYNLDSNCEIVTAPMGPCSNSLQNLEWYDERVVADSIGDTEVNLVLVDGPTAYQPGLELSRYPALNAVIPHMSKKCAVILDDINRAGEQEIVRKWEEETEFQFKILNTKGNYAIGTRGLAFTSSM